MRPGPRLAAAAEILDEIAKGAQAADRILQAYFRARRYAGSGDRNAIIDRVWWILRHQGALAWRMGAGPAATGRALVLASLVARDGLDLAAIEALFDGTPHAPAPLEPGERTALARAAGDAPAPEWVALNLPEGLLPAFRRRYGSETADAVGALSGRAPLDLRVNVLRATRDAMASRLAGQGIETAPTALSPWGLRVLGRERVVEDDAFAQGLIEIQDEGAQLASLLVAAAPGQAVLDFCAGAGGKTLALWAAMKGEGRLVATDSDARRLARLAPRLARAGGTVETHALGGPDDPWLVGEAGRFDRVLVDAPCSLTGTWRRHPEMRWRLDAGDVARLAALQGEILDRAAALVASGGRLVYATCSLLVEEDEDVVAAFLARTRGFRPVAPDRAWAEAHLPGTAPVAGPGLLLDPWRHGTDGFFVAVLERA
jgi:16S rRNA (cytosine967-C5)-methyltransferase